MKFTIFFFYLNAKKFFLVLFALKISYVGRFFGICHLFFMAFFLNCHFFAFFFILLMSNACDILTNIEIFSKNIHFFENCWSIQMFAFFFCLFCFFAFFFVAKILDIFFVFFVLPFLFMVANLYAFFFNFANFPTSVLYVLYFNTCMEDSMHQRS